ncbi:MAG TPA: SRPBCC domain-containing protein [Pyrinomonadaceae bacterium]|nr:SRPBCC domain-containing protein [Pyrinomonadaceae bacterium]
MPDIVHNFPINASLPQVFAAISQPHGLDSWWTKRSAGEPEQGTEYKLYFDPENDWRAIVSRCVPPTEFELQVTSAHADWLGTRVGFVLQQSNGVTQVRFHHSGWPEANDHYQVSCYCWATYLRLLRQYVETGNAVPYEKRLDA